jgi:hypothetical protein
MQTGGLAPSAVVDLGQSPLFRGSRHALVAAEQSTETFGVDDFTSATARSGGRSEYVVERGAEPGPADRQKLVDRALPRGDADRGR